MAARGETVKQVEVASVDSRAAEPIATVRPVGFFGRALFEHYIVAAKRGGARYDVARRCQVIDATRTLELVEALRASGFEPVVAPELLERMRARVAVAARDHGAAVSRLERMDAALQARGMRLFPYQRDGVGWLAPRAAGLLADEMGLGKTVQALVALPEGAAVLVVAPAAVKGNWRNETARWRPDLRPEVLSGRGSFRWPTPGEVLVCNYDILPATAGVPPRGVVIVADEAHALKNGKAQRTERFRKMADGVRKASGRVWLMTGTPLLNRPPELWAVLRAAGLEREAFGSWKEFLRLFSARPGRWGGYEWGSPRPEVAERLRAVSLMRRRLEVLPDLPTKLHRSVEVEIDRETRRQCDEVLEALRAVGVDLTRVDADLERAQTAIPFDQWSRVRAALAAAKTPAILEQVEQYEDAGEPILVFSAHRAPVDALGCREGWATITGDAAPAARTAIVERFQAGELRGIAATIKAAGVGLTLTRANQVLFVDLEPTPALNAQAEDRVCRIGQTRGVIVTRLIAAHKLDERITELLAIKQALIEGSVEASARSTVEDAGALLAAQAARLASAAKKHTAERPAQSADARPTSAPPSIDSGLRRPPADRVEAWAAWAIRSLAGMDHDHAVEKNDVGFNRLDGDLGHSLADQLERGRGLSDKQWSAAVRIARRYPRQVGRPDETNTAPGSSPGAATQ